MTRTVDTERHTEPRTELFEEWPDQDKVEAKDAVLSTTRSEGWTIIREAIDLQIGAIQRQLLDRVKPLEGAADYESKLGEMRGLERIEQLVDGLILVGEEAESG